MSSSSSRRLLAVVFGYIIICSHNILAEKEIKGPVITPNTNEVILKNGQNFTIFCKSSTPVQIKQQHISEIDIGDFTKKQRQLTSPDDDPLREYETALDLYNVDRYAIGYYACFDNAVNESIILNNIQKEPNNTEHVSYIYIYVDDTNKLFAPMRELVMSTPGATVVIECRPTTPDVNVTLIGSNNKKTEFIEYSSKIGFLVKMRPKQRILICQGQRGYVQNDMKEIRILQGMPPKPILISKSIYFLEGETFWLNCSVDYETNNPVYLNWSLPREFKQSVVKIDTNEVEMKSSGILYKNIMISNANAENDGVYKCTANTANEEYASTTKVYKGTKGFINITRGNPKHPIETKQSMATLVINVNDAYPPANYTFYKNGVEIFMNPSKYELKEEPGKVKLIIKKLDINDTANYTVIAANKDDEKTLTFDLRKKADPVITFGTGDKRFPLNTNATLQCDAVGYPVPDIRWYFTTEAGEHQEISKKARNEVKSLTEMTSYLTIPVHTSGNITCSPGKESDKAAVTRRFLVYEISNGFGVINSKKLWFPEGHEAIIKCYASKYDFDNVTWVRNNNILSDFVTRFNTQFSYIAQLKISNIALEDAGDYTCYGYRKDNSEDRQTVFVTVAEKKTPNITIPTGETNEEVNPYQPIRLTCQANGVPAPVITWYKDGENLENKNKSFVDIFTDYLDYTTVNSTIDIKQIQDEHKGKYECKATSGDTSISEFYNLIIKEKSPYKSAVYLSIIGVVVFVLVLLIVYLIWKIRKEKQFRKELAAAGLLYFKEGVTRSLNPELGIDEQAELLPYDERFEFPPEKLTLGKQLGAGAFGVVYKAEARGIINAEETTPVAVKMVKKTADNMYIKALASELKIMVHLGKHVNIVNLLGACTKNVGKRELVVIVEYCKFGNIHNYMQRHREVFIDQLTDDKEKSLGKVNRGFICTTGSTGVQSDYFGSNHSQETDHTFVNTANTNRSGRKDNETVEFVRVSETGYVQPEWRSNYETDYAYEGRNPRPLTSRDLLAWAFQIARGMEYLASRKVLHGDLAARNVLLAEDNIVKICDFGLARSIYKNDEYKKQENSPLPVKWLAIECMTDRIFSTQSDVWSFGIVLWELFSLAKTPYPNISPASLVQWLSDGHRLEKPQYADDRLYDVMKRCWEQKPTARPNFSQLQEILGSFLEDNVRNHYVDLNSAFMDSNVRAEGQEDYLAMMCAPDYNNMVTPSPHHYVNDTRSFFPPTPTQLLHDDEGYLQMSPANQHVFSPRATGNKFDFDARKLNPRASELGHNQGSELTPMLSLNNLPNRSGSESDHDGNISLSYLKMCPRIDKESDEVFETKQYNFKNAQNNLNRAVTNPTYITLEVDSQKKPQNISNNYINVNVPNGLVK